MCAADRRQQSCSSALRRWRQGRRRPPLLPTMWWQPAAPPTSQRPRRLAAGRQTAARRQHPLAAARTLRQISRVQKMRRCQQRHGSRRQRREQDTLVLAPPGGLGAPVAAEGRGRPDRSQRQGRPPLRDRAACFRVLTPNQLETSSSITLGSKLLQWRRSVQMGNCVLAQTGSVSCKLRHSGIDLSMYCTCQQQCSV